MSIIAITKLSRDQNASVVIDKLLVDVWLRKNGFAQPLDIEITLRVMDGSPPVHGLIIYVPWIMRSYEIVDKTDIFWEAKFNDFLYGKGKWHLDRDSLSLELLELSGLRTNIDVSRTNIEITSKEFVILPKPIQTFLSMSKKPWINALLKNLENRRKIKWLSTLLENLLLRRFCLGKIPEIPMGYSEIRVSFKPVLKGLKGFRLRFSCCQIAKKRRTELLRQIIGTDLRIYDRHLANLHGVEVSAIEIIPVKSAHIWLVAPYKWRFVPGTSTPGVFRYLEAKNPWKEKGGPERRVFWWRADGMLQDWHAFNAFSELEYTPSVLMIFLLGVITAIVTGAIVEIIKVIIIDYLRVLIDYLQA